VIGWIEAEGMPAGVRAGTACRTFEGVSAPPFGPANYGLACGDVPSAVEHNRAWLVDRLRLTQAPRWLQQVHGTQLSRSADQRVADAAISSGEPLAILTADCLPILLARDDGGEIAAIHAGWRGLAAGVIEATLDALSAPTARYRAWLGPAIGRQAFEVGPEVRAAVLDSDPGAVDAFDKGERDRWFADLAELARRRLHSRAVAVTGGQHCTVSDARCHSHRRDRERSGRMASLIWREARA
jgi:hypothetical protein